MCIRDSSKTEKVGEGGALLLHLARNEIGDGFFKSCRDITGYGRVERMSDRWPKKSLKWVSE